MVWILTAMFASSVVSIMILWLIRPYRCDVPYCVGCRYVLRGIQHPQCPECGQDLHVCGIVRPFYRPRRPKWIWFLVWTLNFSWLAVCLLPADTHPGGDAMTTAMVFCTVWLLGVIVVALKSYGNPDAATMSWNEFQQSQWSARAEQAASDNHTQKAYESL